MAHAQKPDFVFRRNGRVHLNWQRCQFSRLLAAEVCVSAVVMLDTPSSEVVWRVLTSVQSTTGSRGVRISGSNAGYTMFRGSVKGTGYPLHLPVFLFHFPCVTVCHHVSTGVYQHRVGLTTSLLSRASCLQIREPQPPGPLRACPGIALRFTFLTEGS
jgi:hypothetical protein